MKLEIVEITGSRSKLTISPTEERVTIKVSTRETAETREAIIEFFKGIFHLVGFAVPGTMRGRMNGLGPKGELWIQLISSNEQLKMMFRKEGDRITVNGD